MLKKLEGVLVPPPQNKTYMVGYINKVKNIANVKALLAVHKDKQILHCDNHYP